MTAHALPSMRARLSRVVLTLSLVWGVLMALAVGLMLHRALDVLLDQGLQESAEILYGLAQVAGEDVHRGMGMLPAPPHDEGLVWQRVSAGGQVQLRSHKAPLAPLSNRLDKGFTDEGPWRVYTLPFPGQQGRLLVAQPEAHRDHTQWATLAGTLGLALLVGLTSVLWLNRRLQRELQPLQALSTAVARYNPLETGGARTLPEPPRAELVPMAHAIADLGQRLAARVDHERAFAAHAAHALRTPLAGMDAQLAVALREAPESLRPRLTQTREAATRLRTVVTALISLFRASGELRRQPLELPSLMARLPVRGVQVTVAPDAGMQADADLLSAALMNLLDNAARHQATQVQVAVRQEAGDGACCVILRDNGTGITPERLAAVNAALASGQGGDVLGLGLTLAEQVARMHGGRLLLHAHAAEPDGTPGGVCVEFCLGPLSPSGPAPDPGRLR
jgi:two-component system OmpR family sensor kinase